jgi:RimJ/RimL family protein N-acetyltransferase
MGEEAPSVELRPVREDDVEVFFEHQNDPVAARMASFPSRGSEEHRAHWARILDDERLVCRTIVVDGAVAGNVVSWEADDERLVGYWVGRAFWGRGVATAALSSFLEALPDRPLRARVATSNPGSIRVLEKCGFEVVGERRDGDVDELLFELRADT